MNLFADLPDGVVKADAPLAPLTWFKLGGRADFLLRPQDEQQLSLIVRRCGETQTPIHTLGLGANILVPDEGVRGVVLRLDAPRFSGIHFANDTLIAGGGADMTAIVKRCVREGLTGLEQLAGIPGTVGGGIAMNCGGRYGDISTAVASVETIDPHGVRRVMAHHPRLARQRKCPPQRPDLLPERERGCFAAAYRAQYRGSPPAPRRAALRANRSAVRA